MTTVTTQKISIQPHWDYTQRNSRIFWFCLRIDPTELYVPSEAFLRRCTRLWRRSKQIHSQLHDITRADLWRISCNIFLISRQIPLTKFLLPHYTVRYGDSKDISCFSSTSTHRSQISTNNILRSYVQNKLPTYFRLLHTFAAIFGTNNMQRRVESWSFFLNLQVLQWILVQEKVETKQKKWNFIQNTLFSHNLL